MAIKDSNLNVRWPPRTRGDPATRNLNVYCHFHRDIGHSIENCRNLKEEIEDLIRRGYLKKYIKHESSESIDRQANQRREAPELSKNNDLPQRQPQPPEDRPICGDDARGIQYSHDDALIVKLEINDFEVKQILGDSRSSADVLFLEAFDKLQLEQSDMERTDTPLVGFSGEVVRPLGRITVPVATGMWPNLVRFERTFLVVATLSSYNAILGRPILYALRAVMFIYYLSKKFPTSYEVGIVRGDQLESHKCYVAALKVKEKLAEDVELESPPEHTKE
ncbi:PREDICTED: uncharacterized protein LOC104608458 [Nelumbo nucifera]|uniref:Uncharacterized protein LOC104608458 n=1 Tax=Nelumbo nucifera TaxID=4432 RepID=A0A1U8B9M0_NELNU|nr:PREDICTED: uncharacterized protein LOC104608458 [Nelumbo nucifera]